MSDEAAAAGADNTQTSASSGGGGAGVGGGGGGGGADTNKWCCDVCTYENFPMSRRCTMCRAAKPLPPLSEDILRLQEGASALPVSDGDEISERLKPLRISSPQDNKEKWPCPTCTYENWPRAARCAMCGASPPSPSSPTPASTPAPAARDNQPIIGINDICNSECSARRSKRHIDWLWLQACLGVVDGDSRCVDAYLASGGDPARALQQHEVALLGRSSAFDPGHTLVHLAIRFQRQDILSSLLSRISGGGPGLKRSPSYIAADVAAAIRRQVAVWLRALSLSHTQRTPGKAALPLAPVFNLPLEIEELPAEVQEQLFSELLDREAQQTLEADPPLINWSHEITDTLGSRLYALWNRSAGDCLVDAALQAACGVCDRRGQLRQALAECLRRHHRSFYERWVAWELAAAELLQYCPEEAQLRQEWGRLVLAAGRPQHALHQIHIFVLAHVLRRPIIVYGVNVINSFRGEALGYANFQGVYLPLAWPPAECSKSPLCIGYTRGHFSALVPMEPSQDNYICREKQEEEPATYLPLTDSEGKLLPVHFLTCDEMREAGALVRAYTLTVETRGGAVCARRGAGGRGGGGLLADQLTDDWLNHYRRQHQQTRGPFPPRLPPADSSGPDTDDE